jgi:hypothetical protein
LEGLGFDPIRTEKALVADGIESSVLTGAEPMVGRVFLCCLPARHFAQNHRGQDAAGRLTLFAGLGRDKVRGDASILSKLRLKRDEIWLSSHRALAPRLSMILLENRCAVFRIMP